MKSKSSEVDIQKQKQLSKVNIQKQKQKQINLFNNLPADTPDVRKVIDILEKSLRGDFVSQQEEALYDKFYSELVKNPSEKTKTVKKPSFSDHRSVVSRQSRTPIPPKKEGEFTYRAITANCGNGTLGQKASEQICKKVVHDNADFYVLNLQEARFYDESKNKVDPIRAELLDKLGANGKYDVRRVTKMNTRTKSDAHDTGMACYVIYDTTAVSISDETRTKARRGGFSEYFGVGSDYNKGGLITDFKITGIDKKRPIAIESVSAHLDKGSAKTRMQDWSRVKYELSHDTIKDWEKLCAIIPDLQLVGIDANTRSKEGVPVWQHPERQVDTWALTQAAMGDKVFTSQKDTYSKSSGSGQLDFVGISDNSGWTSSQNAINTNAEFIDVQSDEARDHAVIFSPRATINTKISDFDRVKNQIAKQLARCAPELAKEISQLRDTENNKKTLVKVHNIYLSKGGLLNNKLSQCIKEKSDQKFFGKPWFPNDTLATLNEHTLTDRLITQITDYSKYSDEKKRALLSDEAKDALFSGRSDQDDGKDPEQHRKAFIKYLMERKALVQKMDPGKRKQLIDGGNTEKAGISMEALLDKKGVELYKKALKEERYSEEYMMAVFEESTNYYAGKVFKTPVAIPVGGPSGCGKSFNAKAIVSKIMDEVGAEEGNGVDANTGLKPGNYVTSIDGGVGRGLSKIYQSVIFVATEELGYTLVTDLTQKSKVLGSVKKSVEKAAKIGDSNGRPLNIVIPETFSSIGLNPHKCKKFFKKLQKSYGNNIYYSRIVGPDSDAPDQSTVRYQGVARSAKTKFGPSRELDDLNFDSGALCESKAYDEGIFGSKFWAGVIGSRMAEKVFHQVVPNATSYKGVHQLFLVKPVDGQEGKWEPTTDASAAGAIFVNRNLFKAWQDRDKNSDKSTLEEYKKAHWSDKDYATQVISSENASNVAEDLKTTYPTQAVNTAEGVGSLITVAHDRIAAMDAEDLSFDPQGRVLIKVPECSMEVLAGNDDGLTQQQLKDVMSLRKILFIRYDRFLKIAYRNTDGDYEERIIRKATGNAGVFGGIKPLPVMLADDIVDLINGMQPPGLIIDNNLFDKIKDGLNEVGNMDASSLNRNITVSYDIDLSNTDANKDTTVKDIFLNKIREHLPGTTKFVIAAAYQSIPNKGCIIPLQQEFYFHLSLALRVYQQELVVGMTPDQFHEIHTATMKDVNKEVMKAFANGLVAAYRAGTPGTPGTLGTPDKIDIKTLNKALDQARNDILADAHKTLCEKVREITKQDITSLSKEQIAELKHTAETTTATTDNMLHLDNKMKLATFISGTDVSSHDRGFGSEHVSDMQIAAYNYDPTTHVVTDNANKRNQVLVASLAVKGIGKFVTGKNHTELDCPPLITKGAINLKNIGTGSVNNSRLYELVKKSSKSNSPIFIQDEVKKGFYCKDGNTWKKLKSEQVKFLLEYALAYDVKIKLSDLSQKYFDKEFQVPAVVPAVGGNAAAVVPVAVVESTKPNAFIYNLYTSFDATSFAGNYDEAQNFQNESLEAILSGALLHNREQAKREQAKKGEKQPFCFVQAIAVNGYGDKLGYELDQKNKNFNVVRNEATLMTEMSLLHTIYDSIEDADVKKSIDELFDSYNTFLLDTPPKKWFFAHRSEPVDKIKAIKNALASGDKLKTGNKFGLQKCLAKILAKDLHHTNDARLIQAIAVRCEKNSLSGCKSRNERTQMVNDRVELLDSTAPEISGEVNGALTAFIGEIANVDTAFDTLNRAFDQLCNKNNMHGSASLISNNDQGASYKIKTKSWLDRKLMSFGLYKDTNAAEASDEVMTNLEQKNAKAMQAHNGSEKLIAKAVEVTVPKEAFGEKVSAGIQAVWTGILTGGQWVANGAINTKTSLLERHTRLKWAAIIGCLAAAIAIAIVAPYTIPIIIGVAVSVVTWAGIFGGEAYLKNDEKVREAKITGQITEELPDIESSDSLMMNQGISGGYPNGLIDFNEEDPTVRSRSTSSSSTPESVLEEVEVESPSPVKRGWLGT
jgi:hypothetical protein